jgi:tetratricopeptide (TPR) repeat protein
MILAMSAGLDVSGVMTRDHAFAAAHLGGGDVDVETTNPYGFDPGSRKEFHDQFGKLTGFAYVPSRNYRDRAAISPIELVSLILSNRIAELESRSRFAEAAPLAVDRAALLMGEKYAALPASGKTPAASGDSSRPFFDDPRRDMMSRLFNYGASLLQSGREDDCLRWAAFAAPRYPDEKSWQELALAATNNRIQKLVKSGQTGAARDFLDNQKTALSPANYAQMDSILLDTELLNGASRIRNVSEGDSLLAAIGQAQAGKRLSAERAAELLTFTIQKTAAILSAAPARDWLAAIDYIEKAIARFGSSRELEQTLRNYRTNRAADFHNRFAAAWNRQHFEEAARILNQGLAEFPDNRQLLADRKIAESAR